MTLEDVMRLMLVRGRYLMKCRDPMLQRTLFGADPPPPAERFKLYDSNGSPVIYIDGTTLARWNLWRVIKKDNDLAYRRQIHRYYISRRKILSLRKNNRIKRTYKKIRSAAALCQHKH